MFPRPVILAIAAATVTLATATGATAGPSASPQVKVISSCTKATYQPSSYILFCGDANAGLQKAAYGWWTTKTAHGTGIYSHNDCTPNCASGHEKHGKAEFTLYRIRNTAKYGPLFTRIEVDTRSSHHVFELPTSTL